MSWLDDYEAPHFRTKIPFNWRPLVTFLIAVVVIVSVVYYFMNLPPVPPVVVQTTTQTTITTNSTVAKEVFKSEAPSFDSKCTVVAGVIPGSILRDGNKISFTFKNNGKISIEGSYFEASNNDVKAYRKNSDALEPGATATYSIDLDDVSSEVGVQVNSFVILPIQNGKACLNQRMIVIG